MATVILFNKPYGVLSQFRPDDNNDYRTLGDVFDDKALRVAGRLDATSEGLLLLTDDGQINYALTSPPKPLISDHLIQRFALTPHDYQQHGKTYWVQLEGVATDAQIHQLEGGVQLKDGMTLPAQVTRLDQTDIATLWQAPDPIAKRAVTSWLSLTIVEGKNRQVRRMTAHVGLPCLRLIRVASSGFELGGLGVGEYQTLSFNTAERKQLLSRLGMNQIRRSQGRSQPSTSHTIRSHKPHSTGSCNPIYQINKPPTANK